MRGHQSIQRLFAEPDDGEITVPGTVGSAERLVRTSGIPVPIDDHPRVLAGRYELRRRLGSGGMADVYLAHDRTLRRDVAVKLLRPEMAADRHLAERFAREARALAAVDSPHVVPIYDVVTGADTFLVLRHVTGRSLDNLLAHEAPLSLQRAAHLIAQVLDGLAELHARRLVHRDLKPANVLVESGDRAVIIDLGVALDGRVPKLTPAHIIAGTPAFMAPEHRSGGKVDPRSDLYQVGFLLAHAASGVDPARLDDGQRKRLIAGLDAPLDDIVARALADEPGDRFRGAAAMRDALIRGMLARRTR